MHYNLWKINLFIIYLNMPYQNSISTYNPKHLDIYTKVLYYFSSVNKFIFFKLSISVIVNSPSTSSSFYHHYN